jgi:hypothetical protein
MATKTKLPKGTPKDLPSEIAKKIAYLRGKGNSVWCIQSPVIHPLHSNMGDCRLWIVLYKPPHYRKIYGYQWERWQMPNEANPRQLVETTDWVWNHDYAQKEWEKLVAKGWTRIV